MTNHDAELPPDDEGYWPDPTVLRHFSISDTTLKRWDEDESLGFPKPLTIRGRRYRSVRELRAFKERMRQNSVPTWKPRGCVGTSDEAA